MLCDKVVEHLISHGGAFSETAPGNLDANRALSAQSSSLFLRAACGCMRIRS